MDIYNENITTKSRDTYTKTDVKNLGFSEKMISVLLPEPKKVPNPNYKKAAPMQLWDKKNSR